MNKLDKAIKAAELKKKIDILTEAKRWPFVVEKGDGIFKIREDWGFGRNICPMKSHMSNAVRVGIANLEQTLVMEADHLIKQFQKEIEELLGKDGEE